MWIQIEDGNIFEGTEDQLDDCFGIRIDELHDWCDFNGWKYQVFNEQPLTPTLH